MKPVVVLMACLALAGCNRPDKAEPVVRTVTVKVPTPVSCVPDSVPPEPDYPYTTADLLAMAGGEDRYIALAGLYLLMQSRLEVLEPVIRSCRPSP